MDNKKFPKFVTRYFWGDDLAHLDLVKNQKYIIQVILEKGGKEAVGWVLSTFTRQKVKNILPSLKLSKKSANFWNIYLS